MNKKYIYLGIGACAVIIGSVFVISQTIVQPMLDNRTVEEVVGTPIVLKEYKLGFNYPSGVEGFVLIEPPVATTSQSLKKAYLMFEYGQYIEYQNAEENKQTPPAVSIFVFTFPEKIETDTRTRSERLLQWIKENPQYTSFNKIVGDIAEVEIDGVQGMKYRTQGLYTQDFHIAYHAGNAYIFAAQYQNTEDENVAMYDNLINSVTFY